MARNKWIPIVLGIVIFVVIVGIGLIGGAIYVFTRQVEFQAVETADAEKQFEKLRTGFEGQTPFIELTGDGEFEEPRAVVHRELAGSSTGKVSTVHIRVWSPEERKLVSLDLPFWMVRLMGNKPIPLPTFTGICPERRRYSPRMGTWKSRSLIRINDCSRTMAATKKGSVVVGWLAAQIFAPPGNCACLHTSVFSMVPAYESTTGQEA